ncbi:MAG TPA: carboxypeptidase-like regulatory domain-containing protein [Candidatus Acidoferrum sp.]|nr:carboxypeptidase-like regulatory domain-containing protein [Candidatus Acidoferrum sp.]
MTGQLERRQGGAGLIVTVVGVAFAIVSLGAGHAAAQTADTGALGGTVTDPSGAVVPGARVRVTSRASGERRTADSGARGAYLVPLLRPGSYSVTVSKSGFETSTYSSIPVEVTETATLNVRMQIGSIGQAVSVASEASQLQTVSSALGHITDERMIESLPLDSRNYTQILGLSPGVSGDINDASALGRGTTSQAAARGGYSVSGAATTDNNTQMNGIGVNDLMGASDMSGGVPVPNPDTIEEFKVQTAMYDAAYGRNAGANVDVITKSGTNAFHGDAWEFFRNSALNANDFFLKASGQPRGVLDQNQFGFTLGGPVEKNKLFFFGSYQGTRQKDGLTSGCLSAGSLPVALTNSGDSRTPAALLSEFAGYPTFLGQVIGPGSTISPLAISLLNAQLPGGAFMIPAPQNTATGATILSSACTYNDDQYLGDIDWYASEKTHLAFDFFWFNSRQVEEYPSNPFGLPVFNAGGFPQAIPTDARVISVTATRLITDDLLNQMTFGFHRLPSALDQEYPNVTYALPGCSASISGVVTLTSLCATAPAFDNPYPAIGILPSPEGGFDIGGWGEGLRLAQNFYEFSDSLSYVRGSHDLHFGGGITRSQMNQDRFHFLAALIYPTFADFLLGNVLESADVPGLTARAYRATNADAYIQDNYRVKPTLTFNLGLRYEFQGAIGDALGRQSTMDLGDVNPNPPASGTVDGYVVASNFSGILPTGVVRSSNTSALNDAGENDWEPRLGFAWQLPHNRRFVLRGGYGLFYTRSTGEPYVQLLSAPPFGLYRQFVYVPPASPTTALPPAPDFPQFLPYSPTTALSPIIFSPQYQPARSQDYGLNLQAEFFDNWLLEVGYHGSQANHLSLGKLFDQALEASPSTPVRGLTENTAANLPERQPYLGFAPNGALEVESTGSSSYNALEASVSKRLSRGLEFLASYTWATALENDPSYATAARLGGQLIGNQNDPNANYGFDPFIRPQRLIVSYLYDLPGPVKGAWSQRVLGGWQVAGVVTFQSGDWLTFTDTDANNAFLGAGATDFPDLAAGCTHASLLTPGSIGGRLNHYFTTSCLAAPPVITADGATAFGNAGTSIVRGPAQEDFDVAVIKDVRLNEARNLQFRGEFFNAFNTPSFSDPSTNVGTAEVNASGAPMLALSNIFGTITSTSVNPRIVQLAIKLLF